MVYFQGKIVLANDDFSFVTSESQSSTEKAVTGRILESDLTNAYGAHLLCLDLVQNTNNLTASDIWPKAPNLGIIMTNWKGPGPQPRNTQLISALELALPKTRIVGDLSASIDRQYQSVRERFPEEIETDDRLRSLQNLPLGVLE